MDSKISDLDPVASPLDGTEVVPMDQGSPPVTLRATTRDIATLAQVLQQNEQNGSYVLALTDAGGSVLYAGPGGDVYTIPLQAVVPWVPGTAITIIADGGGDLTISPDGDLQQAGTTNTGFRTLSSTNQGMATIYYIGDDVWRINGAGLA